MTRLTILLGAVLALAAAPATAAELPADATAILSGAPSLSETLPMPVGETELTTTAVSTDGRYVAFTSSSDGLFAGDDDRVSNVFVKDTQTGDVLFASRATGTAGEPAHADCREASISDDGTRVGFTCRGPLDPADTNDDEDVYVRDLATLDTFLVSRASSLGPVGDDRSVAPVLSRNGEYVAFVSNALNLDPSATQYANHVFRRRIGTGDKTVLVSRAPGAAGAAAHGIEPSIDDEGGRIAFTAESDAIDPDDTNTSADVYVRDVSAGTTVLVSRADGNGAVGNGLSRAPSIAGDGNSVAFESNATQFDNSQDPYDDFDIYRRALTTKATALVSVTAGGSKGTGSHSASSDEKGRRIAFVMRASLHPDDGDAIDDVYVKDVDSNVMYLASRSGSGDKAANADADAAAISRDGKHVAALVRQGGRIPGADGTHPAVIVRELATPYSTLLVARPPGNGPFVNEGGYAGVASLSEDARFAAFATSAPALVPGGVGSGVVVRDRITGDVTFASRRDGAAGTPFERAGAPSISADGRRVAFVVVNGTAEDSTDVWVRDLVDGRTWLASRADGENGAPAGGVSIQPAISGDGRRVAFITSAKNLGDGDTDTEVDVHVRDIELGRTILASRADGPNGTKADGYTYGVDINADGTRVAFTTTAKNLGDGDTDALTSVFLRDLAAETTVLVSRVPGGPNADRGTGYTASIDAAGNRVAFDTPALNLPGGGTPTSKVYVRDLAAGTLVVASRADGADGRIATSFSGNGILSPDGGHVAFLSLDALVDGAPPNTGELYLRDLGAGRTRLVSRRDGATGAPTTDYAYIGDVSAGGGCVSFTTEETMVGTPVDAFQSYVRSVRPDCAPADAPGGGGAPGSGDGAAGGDGDPNGGGVDPAGTADRVAPVLSRVRLSRKRFRVGRGRRRGAVLSFRSSEAGTITIVLERNMGKRHRRVGKTTRRIGAGTTRIRLTGVVGRRRLKAGRHRLSLVARDAAGNASRPVRRGFAIIDG
jgi:Tol biopolymer transport system component